MAQLRLGPLLRYVDEDKATVWVEADRPATVTVVCDDGADGTERTWQIAGHHYAIVTVGGLRPGTTTAYRVLLDGREVWPLPDSPYPPSTIRTAAHDGDGGGDGEAEGRPLRVAFGSCRWAAPPPDEPDPLGPDALDTLAHHIASGDAPRPDLLLLLGDQIYADETSAATRRWLARRRDLNEPPWDQVADYEEYTHLYYESWLDPDIRWLLSTVPSCMIFDDHDVIDDWNTSHTWRNTMRETAWWQERVTSGLTSYWVHQHLGNLTPAELAADTLLAAVRAADDGTETLRAFAARVEADPAHTRWSYRRDLGRTRLLMVDSRAARVLDEHERAMLDPEELDWLRRNARPDGSFDHLLIGTSLPWLLPHAVHAAEAWSAAICRGSRGHRWTHRGERLRQAGDLEHWSAFPDSFDDLAGILTDAADDPEAPATICVLSGDVHHAYTAEAHRPGTPLRSRLLQLTCSPVHNTIPGYMRLAFRFAWTGPARLVGRALTRHGRAAAPALRWGKLDGPWFGNQLMTLTLRGRAAALRLDQTRAPKGTSRRAGLVTVMDTHLTRD
ncbi:alkaline phosphatase D family protein [Actinacidiphila glaucinigra]|uniref:alkaline phosphatase D family protein n=1 Tax=Actinacidiphila glaucinigra TaxID=235986 RepID=UPI0036EA91C0